MIEEPIRIKICGLTDLASTQACVGAGVDCIGLNFHPGSPRFVEERKAATLLSRLPTGIETVGLFVDRPPGEVDAIAGRLGLDWVQLHGEEPPEVLLALGSRRVIRAFRLRDSESIRSMEAYLRRAASLGREPEAILVDAFVDGRHGGTGRSIPPALLDEIPTHPRLILAGGLTAENVSEVLERRRPWMVDVSSGVESSPGRKDPARISAFSIAVRGASSRR